MAGLKKLLKRHTGKKGSASKEDVRFDGGEMALGYVITKEKDLPKIHKAVWTRDTAKVKQLCKKADINQFDKENRTPLHLAASSGNEEITQFLLANRAKSNLCDNDGRTALMKAIECSHYGCIDLLLEYNADVKATDKNSSSTLHLAAANNLADVGTRLLERGLDINIYDKEGFTALHVASSLGNQDFVLFLLNKGANVNKSDEYGRTPLMTGAAEGHADIVKMLLQNNADFQKKDAEGWKATDHATMNGMHSCAKIIDEHENRQNKEKEKKNEEVPEAKKKPDINEVLRSSSPIAEDLGFSFGGPAADKVNVDAHLRSEGSTSRQSDVDDSWATSSGDEHSEANKKTTKISLASALQKVDKSASNMNEKTVLSQESISSPESPISRPMSSSLPTLENRPSAEVTQPSSPRDVSATSKQKTLSPTPSMKSVGSTPKRNSPRTSSVGASPQSRPCVVSPSESVRSSFSGLHGRVSGRESAGSLPLQYRTVGKGDTDSDQTPKKKTGETHGYSPSFMSPRSDRSNRNLADELGLSLSSSEGELEEDGLDSAMSGEVDLDRSDKMTTKPGEMPKNLTSTVKTEEDNQNKEAKNPAAYLGLDLDSSISSVSDPNISSMSNHDKGPKKTEKIDKAFVKQPDEPEKNEDTDSDWDSSEGFLPSDNESASGKTSSRLAKKSSYDEQLNAAVERRREILEKSQELQSRTKREEEVEEDEVEEEEGDEVEEEGEEEECEVTESESEWAKEREEARRQELEKMKESAVVQLKVEEDRKKEVEKKLQLEMEKEKEQARRMEWERQEKEREAELAKSIKKELEEELGINSENERSEEIDGSHSETQSEVEPSDNERKQGEGRALGDFEEQGSSKWDSTEDGPDDEVSDEDCEVLRDSEGSLGLEGTPEDGRISKAMFEKQMELEGKEKLAEVLNENNNNVIKEPVLVQEESYTQETSSFHNASSPVIEEYEGKKEAEDKKGTLGGNNGIVEDARRLQKEEDDLLEAYKARQEEMLEQERRIEEELARKEQERLEELRLELEKRKEEEKKRMDELEKQRKERELALQKKKEAFELEMKRKKEKEAFEEELRRKKEKEAFEDEIKRKKEREREIEEMNLRKRQAEEESNRKAVRQDKGVDETEKDEERKSRLKRMFDSSSERGHSINTLNQSSGDLEPVCETEAERSLTEKHRGFVDDAANSAAIEVQKVQNRERLADRSREIKQRRWEAKADLDAVRLQSTKLSGTPKLNLSNKRESPSSVARETMPATADTEKINASPPHMSGVNSDWSTSEDEREVPLSRAKTPLSSGDGGLGSNLSPRVQNLVRPSLLQSMPLLSSSPAVMDSSPVVVQLKSSLRDTKRQLEKAQEKLVLSETKVQQLEGHADDLQSKLEEVVHQKSAVERELFEINEENRLLKHECLRAMEDKKIAEALVETLKDQLGRSEEKLIREIKLRRTVEETGKQLELDRLNLENALRHLNQENEDIKRALEREQEQCRLKDELYNEQKKQNEEIIMESQKVSQHRAEVLTKLESVDENRKNVEASSEFLRKELIHAKSEVARLHSQLETVTKLSQNEVDLIKKQLTEQSDKNKQLDDTLGRLRSEYGSQVCQLQTKNNELQNKLESEVTEKHGLQSEVTLLRGRLESVENERHEANKTRAETERQLHSLREELYKSKSTLEKELSSLRENNQLYTLKFNTAENKISSLEAELQSANIMLAERSSQMSINIRDIDNKRASLSKLETELRTEKDTNARLSAKLETASEKMLNLETESAKLRHQLEIASENSQETQNKLNSTISEIRTDYEKTKGKVNEKERSLADVIEKYKEEMEQNFSRLKLQDENIRTLQQELAQASRKLSAAEASLEIQLKARENLEEERDHLRQTLRTYEGQMTAKINENQIMNGHASALQNELEHSRKVSDETSQRLATTTYDLENLEKVKTGLEEDITKLKLDRVKLEATLKEEKAKTNLLLKEIQDDSKGRTHLESLLSQIKSSNIELEEKLQAETFHKSQHAREAEEAKGLWESEVRARSKLGAKIMEMENKLNESKAAVEEERKKTRKALDSRKALQGKLDIYEKRADQHVKEVENLKTQIRSYKRRLKELEMTDKRIPAMQAEFYRETQQYEATITSLRNQLRDLNERLRQENDSRILAERREQQNEKDLSLAKVQAKEQSRQVQKLEKFIGQMKDDMERLKDHYSGNFVEKTELDRMKIDLEAKSRIELNRKLADVNAHLEEQALAREALERSRNEQEASKLRELENTVSRLKRELNHSRSNFHDVQSQKQTIEAEAEKFKDMYESEAKKKEKLNDLLFKEREKSAESKAFLNLERSRSSKLLGNSGVNVSYLEQSPGGIAMAKDKSLNSKSPGLIYSQPKEKLMESVDKELSKSIQRHLDTISSSGLSDHWAKEINMTSSPLSSSTSQYMETLKRNYFV